MNYQNFIPVNSTAKKVIQKGVHYECECKEPTNQELVHKNQLKRLNKKIKSIMSHPSFIDFVGHKHGTFTVIKYIGKCKWSCKCSCGSYEIRSTKAIKNHKEKQYDQKDTCYLCMDNEKLKNIASSRSQGYEYSEYMEKIRPGLRK